MAAAEVPRPTADEQVVHLKLVNLKPSKTNPRHIEDDAALLGLVEDINHRGIQVPILVRPSGQNFEIICGHRRFAAAKKAKLEAVPAIVRQLDDNQAYELQVIENLQRENLHPLDEAEAFARLIKVIGSDTPERGLKVAAERLGKTQQFIAQRLVLNELIDKAKEHFREGKMLLGHAFELARLAPNDQERAFKFLASAQQVHTRGGYVTVANAVTVDVLRAWIRGNLMLDLSHAPFDVSDPTLSKQYGACTTCPHRTTNNPSLFGDVTKGDLCTVPEDFFHKRDVTITRKIAKMAQDRGVSKLLRVGLGSSWDNDPKKLGHIEVDCYVGESGSNTKMVAKGDECEHTKPGIIVYKSAHVDAKLLSEVSVCTKASDCPKHKNASTFGDDSWHRQLTRPSATVRDEKRIANLEAQLPVFQRNALIKALCEKAVAYQKHLDKKTTKALDEIASQMRNMIYSDRNRELVKNVLGLDPRKFKTKEQRGGVNGYDYQRMAASVLGEEPFPWLVAMACMNQYGYDADYKGLVEVLGVDVKKVRAQVTADVKARIAAIREAAKRRKARTDAKPKAKGKVRKAKAAK